MNKVRVYIGYYLKDNHESLFYGVDSNYYYDLKKDKKVTNCEIDGLVPFNNVIECGIPTKRNIIKCYDIDRMKKVKLDRTFIGNVCLITELENKGIFGPYISTKFTIETIMENALLYVKNRIYLKSLNQAKFQNLEDNEEYQNPSLPRTGNLYIPSKGENGIKLVSCVLDIHQTEIEKGKLLEKYRDWRNHLWKLETYILEVSIWLKVVIPRRVLAKGN